MGEKASAGKVVLVSVLGCAGVVATCALGTCALIVIAPPPPPPPPLAPSPVAEVHEEAAAPIPEPLTAPASAAPAPEPAPSLPPAVQRPRCPALRTDWGPTAGEHVGRDVMGGEWPLTVDGGCLYCDRVGAVVFVHAGRTYGINGIAHRYGDVEPIWEEHPQIEGARLNIGPLIQRGRRLCPSAP